MLYIIVYLYTDTFNEFKLFLNKGDTCMKSIGEIISTRRKRKGISQTDLAILLSKNGIKATQKSISKWETDTNDPNVNDFLNLCRILEVEDIYEEYFGSNPYNIMAELNEEGKNKVKDYIELLIASGLYKKEPKTVTFKRFIRIYDIPVSAGVGNFLEDSTYSTIEVDSEVPNTADFGVKISGNSMEPLYINGQNVYVHSQNTINDGEIGIFYLDGNVYIKKFHKTADECMLISLNTEYKPIKVKESSVFNIIGKVVG